ncbi:hypothetical protein D3C80_1955830 [compost metagenome]
MSSSSPSVLFQRAIEDGIAAEWNEPARIVRDLDWHSGQTQAGQPCSVNVVSKDVFIVIPSFGRDNPV